MQSLGWGQGCSVLSVYSGRPENGLIGHARGPESMHVPSRTPLSITGSSSVGIVLAQHHWLGPQLRYNRCRCKQLGLSSESSLCFQHIFGVREKRNTTGTTHWRKHKTWHLRRPKVRMQTQRWISWFQVRMSIALILCTYSPHCAHE